MPEQTFRLVLIKPSHYDDEGYVIQWLRSSIPSNTLAALYGLGMDAAKRQTLGKDVKLVVEPYDETNTVIPVEKIIEVEVENKVFKDKMYEKIVEIPYEVIRENVIFNE